MTTFSREDGEKNYKERKAKVVCFISHFKWWQVGTVDCDCTDFPGPHVNYVDCQLERLVPDRQTAPSRQLGWDLGQLSSPLNLHLDRVKTLAS